MGRKQKIWHAVLIKPGDKWLSAGGPEISRDNVTLMESEAEAKKIFFVLQSKYIVPVRMLSGPKKALLEKIRIEY